MRCRFLCAGFLASVAAGAGSAVAADYPVRPLPAPAAAAPIAVAPVYVPDWVGFYVGIHGGGGTAFREWAELWAKRGYVAVAGGIGGDGRRGQIGRGVRARY